MSEKPHSPEQGSDSSQSNESVDQLEVATGFDDLDMEIVSESPVIAPTRPEAPTEPEAKSNKSGELSIDDFEVTGNQPTSGESTRSRDQWFMKVLGQEMGPFSFEDLITLVVDEEVGPKDLLRHGKNGEWIVANEIAGLFPGELDDDFELEAGVELHSDFSSDLESDTDFKVVGGQINHILSDVRAPQPTPLEGTASKEAQTEKKSEEVEKAPAPQLTPEEAEAKRKEEVANRLNSWLSDKVAAEEPPSKAEAEPAQTKPTPEFQPTSTPTPYTPPAGGPTPPSRPTPPKIKKTKPPREKMDFSGLAVVLDPKVLGGVGAVLLVAGLWFGLGLLGGTNDKAIHKRYTEIYAQIERARKGNPAQLTSLGKEVIPELEATVKALEKAGAGAKKPGKQKLFFAGKYCLIPILKKKIVEPGKLDDKFKTHQKEAAKILGI